MKDFSKQLTVAVVVTILDVMVALPRGLAIWRAWTYQPWGRELLCFLACGASATLADIWARAWRAWPGSGDSRRPDPFLMDAPSLAEMREGRDV